MAKAKSKSLAEQREIERLESLGMRRPGDQNRTPREAFEPFESVLLDLLERHCCAQVLDPGAGGGGLLLMADDLVRRAKKAQSYHERLPAILGFEIDELLHEECVAEQVPCVLRDALSEESWHVGAMVDEDRSVVVMNPPYSRAQEFVERACREARLVIALLRAEYLGSGGRADSNSKLRPAMHVLRTRPRFMDGTRQTDFYNSAWFVFGDEATAGRWFIL